MTTPKRTATFSNHSRHLAITQEMVDQKVADARANPRRREILVLHDGDGDSLQRMLNAMEPGSYVRPHRHVTPPKAEGLVVLSGSLAFVAFDDEGEPDAESFLVLSRERGVLGIDYRAGLWHTFFALETGSVVYEVKPGPYDAATDKEFASWAPEEGSPEADEYLERLESLFRQRVGLPPR